MYGLVIPLFLQVLTAPDDQSPEKKKNVNDCKYLKLLHQYVFFLITKKRDFMLFYKDV